MRLKKLQAFITEYFDEPRPRPRTVQQWPGARKIGGYWYIDLDVWLVATQLGIMAHELEHDPEVAALVREE